MMNKVLISILSIIITANIFAQDNDSEARAYYFAAEQAYRSGEYSRASKSLDQAIELLGEKNPVVSSLRVKILFAMDNYTEAKREVAIFFSYSNSAESMKKEMADYLNRIDEKIEEKERLRIAEEERMRQEARAEELARIASIEAEKDKVEARDRALNSVMSMPVMQNSKVNVVWKKGYGFQEKYDRLVVADFIEVDDGVVFVGSGVNNSSTRAWIYKTDFDGNLIWQKFIGGSQRETGKHILKTREGGFLISGNVSRRNGSKFLSDIYLVKISDKGEVQWQRIIQFEDRKLTLALVEHEDGFVIAEDNELILINKNGDFERLVTVRGVRRFENLLAHNNSNKILAIASSDEDSMTTNIYEYEVSANKFNQLNKFELSSGNKSFITRSTATTESGKLVEVADLSTKNDNTFANNNLVIRVVDAAGTQEWEKVIINNESYDFPNQIISNSAGNYMIVGWSSESESDRWVDKLYSRNRYIAEVGKEGELWRERFKSEVVGEIAGILEVGKDSYLIVSNMRWDEAGGSRTVPMVAKIVISH